MSVAVWTPFSVTVDTVTAGEAWLSSTESCALAEHLISDDGAGRFELPTPGLRTVCWRSSTVAHAAWVRAETARVLASGFRTVRGVSTALLEARRSVLEIL